MESRVAVLRHDGGNCIKFTSCWKCSTIHKKQSENRRKNTSEEKKSWEFFHYIYFKLCMHKRYKVIIFEQTLFNAPSPDPNTFALKSTNICCYCLLMQTPILTLLVLFVLFLPHSLFLFLYLCISVYRHCL